MTVAEKKKKTRTSGEVKKFIVQQLAEFIDHSEIAENVQKEFGVKISRQTVTYYNCHKSWKKRILKARDLFLSQLDNIPIFHKAYRLKQLQRTYNKIKDGYIQQAATKDGCIIDFKEYDPHAVVRVIAEAQKIAEPIEKKVYGSETRIENTGGGNITVNQYQLESKSDDELAARKDELWGRIQERIKQSKSERFSDN